MRDLPIVFVIISSTNRKPNQLIGKLTNIYKGFTTLTCASKTLHIPCFVSAKMDKWQIRHGSEKFNFSKSAQCVIEGSVGN